MPKMKYGAYTSLLSRGGGIRSTSAEGANATRFLSFDFRSAGTEDNNSHAWERAPEGGCSLPGEVLRPNRLFLFVGKHFIS
jgi:hypothetical protein